ncbi:MAG: ATP-NAD kinase family protein [Thermoplasmata archaeon]|nr:MAG: ATP-NAD kinase family protein [Thermoplasmata archaeon]
MQRVMPEDQYYGSVTDGGGEGRPRVGLVVNPVAGMGGRVGLKGTDGLLDEALRLGAEPVAPDCMARFLERLGEESREVVWITCAFDMGADELREAGLRPEDHYTVAYTPPSLHATNADDTMRACKAIVGRDVDVLVFCGGDGTARDVLSAVDDEVPVLGVPSGVKMFSGIFALSPEAAAEVLSSYIAGETEVGEGEVVDVDEAAYREGRLACSLFGTMPILRARSLIQDAKRVTSLGDEGAAQDAIARFVVEMLEREDYPLTVLGAGTTVEAVARRLGVPKTPLGVDVVRGTELVSEDASEDGLLQVLAQEGKARIVLSPIGAQGFLLGRGNQQISPEVLEAAGGPAALIIVATPHKLRAMDVLRVDTGDPELDLRLEGMRQVVTGFHDVTMRRLEAASAPPE